MTYALSVAPFRCVRLVLALFGLLCALAVPTTARAELRHCAPGQCASGETCHYGLCKKSCTVDGDCTAANHEACVLGACVQTAAITFPNDYGLTGASQPGCRATSDCNPTVTCNSSSRCQLPLGCVVEGSAQNNLCPFGFTCDLKSDTCIGGTCDPAVAGACAAAYPVGGLVCLNGRCSSPCTMGTDCCAAGTGKKCPAADTQGQCFATEATPLCTQSTGTGRVIAAQVFNADLRATKNIIFIGEGFVSSSDRDHFVAQAFRHVQYQTTHADMFQALFGRVNIFIVDLPDKATGIGQPTLFGASSGPQSLSITNAGALEQAQYIARLAVRQYASTIDPTLVGVLKDADPTDAQILMFYNVGGGPTTRAFSFANSIIFQPVGNNDGPGFSDDPFNNFFVLTHELGHGFGRLVKDEYDDDSAPPGAKPQDFDCKASNLTPRSAVTSPSCDACSTSAWLTNESAWGDFVNTTTFPSSGGFDTVGLVAGGGRFWTQQVMRSQVDCIMRQGGRPHFCPACREALIRNMVPDTVSLPFRFLDLASPVLEPTDFGVGPNVAVGASSTAHELYLTRVVAGGSAFSVVDANVLTRETSRDLSLDAALAGADVPSFMAVDDAGGRVFLHAPNFATPAQSRLLVYSRATKALATPVVVPGLDSPPIVSSATNRLFATRVDPTTNASQLATVDLTAATLTPTFSVPATGGVMPTIDAAPLAADVAGLIFFSASKQTPAEPFCDINHCQIWAFNPQTQTFLNGVLEVDTAGSVLPGIQAATIGVRPSTPGSQLSGELLIAATDRRVFIWKTADVLAGNVTPVVTFEHDLGGTSVVSSIAYSAPRERVMIGNRNGELGWYPITGTGAPLSQKVVVPQLETGMQVRDIRAEPDGGVWVALGGFSGPRRGLVLSMDFTGPDASIVSVQPVASIGLTKPAFAVDASRSIVYSNAVVNTGDSLGIADQRRYRIPLFRGYHEVRHDAAHCP